MGALQSGGGRVMLRDAQPEQSQAIPITDLLYFAKTAAERDRKGSRW
jgi:hypothetical protein